MDKKIHVNLFRFDHKTDYLPYYKKHTIIYNDNETVQELLNKINAQEKFSFNGVENHGIRINNLFLEINTLIEDVVSKTSNEFTIEPVSIYRATSDLTINNSDFFEKLDLFDDYLTKEQKDQFASSLQLEYYASNSLNFNKDYIGDHSMIIASNIIDEKPELKKEILKLLDNKENGAWYYTSKDKRVFDINLQNKTKIENMLQQVTNIQPSNNSTDLEKPKNISQEFNDFNIAVYDKESTCLLKDIIIDSKATYIDTTSKNDDLAIHSMEADKNFSYKIAGNILLDAKDNNADFIVVKDQNSFSLLDNKQKEISCVIGRDIELPIVTAEQFTNILQGEKDYSKLGFKNHKVAVPFL